MRFQVRFDYDRHVPKHAQIRPFHTKYVREKHPNYDTRARNPDVMGDPGLWHQTVELRAELFRAGGLVIITTDDGLEHGAPLAPGIQQMLPRRSPHAHGDRVMRTEQL